MKNSLPYGDGSYKIINVSERGYAARPGEIQETRSFASQQIDEN